MRLIDQIQDKHPCQEAINWLGDKTLEQAWAQSERGDWMLWLYRRSKGYRKAILVRAFARMPQDMLDFITSKVSDKEYVDALAELTAAVTDLRAKANTAMNQNTPAAHNAANSAAIRYTTAFENAKTLKERKDTADAWAAANANKLRIAADLCREHLDLPTL